MPPVAKAKKKLQRRGEIEELMSPRAARKAERKLRDFIMELDERSEERESYVQTILKANDESVLETVALIVEQLEKMSPTQGDLVTFEGQSYRLVGGEAELAQRIRIRNFRYIAIRVLVACAEWDIKVGDFTLPRSNCARCGKKV